MPKSQSKGSFVGLGPGLPLGPFGCSASSSFVKIKLLRSRTFASRYESRLIRRSPANLSLASAKCEPRIKSFISAIVWSNILSSFSVLNLASAFSNFVRISGLSFILSASLQRVIMRLQSSSHCAESISLTSFSQRFRSSTARSFLMLISEYEHSTFVSW